MISDLFFWLFAAFIAGAFCGFTGAAVILVRTRAAGPGKDGAGT